MKFLRSLKNKIMKRPESLLTVASLISLTATVIVTGKESTKALLILNEAEYVKKDDLTISEKIHCTWKCYIPTILLFGLTASCIVGSDILGRRREANLTAAYIFLEQSIKNYKSKVNEATDDTVKQKILKEKADELVPKPHEDDKLLFYTDHCNEFFERTMLEVLDAEYQLNRKLVKEDCCTLNDFFEFLGVEKTPIGNLLGWGYESFWIDFEHTIAETDDGLECYMITMQNPPSVNYLPF